MKATPISNDLPNPKDSEAFVSKRLPTKPESGLYGLLPQPAKALTLEEMEAGVAAHLKAKHAPVRAV